MTFQRVMEGLLKFIQGLLVYLDDIFVSGLSEGKDLSSLKQLLTRLQEAGEKVSIFSFCSNILGV